jgi:3D-(3,5/4)-trihydroxycyclohexane-1,2-dione acylhydrolase (decyclizing)
VFAIFGHGNVAGIGEALQHVRERLPTCARTMNTGDGARRDSLTPKGARRRQIVRVHDVDSDRSTNMVTASALAHVNRLPVLLLPGDVFASRQPDPVLQQVEDFNDPTITANDCFRPVSRFWDRIVRPEQLLKFGAGRVGVDGPRRLRTGHARVAAGCAGGGVGYPSPSSPSALH